MSEIKAVLFNIDDTLFDNRYSTREALRLVWMRFTHFHKSTIDEMEAEYFRILEEMHFAHVIFGKLSLEEMLADIFKHMFLNRGLEVDFHTASNAAVMFRNKYKRIRRVINGSEELLSALNEKYRLGVVTNNSDAESEEKLDFTGYDKYINSVTTSQETGVAKPTGRIFKIALEKLEVMPEHTVMIGNSWEWDVLGAHKLGIKPIWLNNYNDPYPDPNIAVEIKSLDDTQYILRLIENGGRD